MEEGGRGELGERATKTSLPLERPQKFSSTWVSSHHHYHHQFPCFWCIYSSIYSSSAWTPFHFFVGFGLDASCNIKINDFSFIHSLIHQVHGLHFIFCMSLVGLGQGGGEEEIKPQKFSSTWVSSHQHYHHQYPCFWCIYSSIYSSSAWTPFLFFFWAFGWMQLGN